MRKSVIQRIATPYLLLILIIFVIAGLVLTGFIKNIYFSTLEKNLFVNAQLVNERLTPELISKNSEGELDKIISLYSQLTNSRVSIIEPDGEVIADSEANVARLQNHANRPEIISALNSGFGKDIRFSQSVKEDFMYVAIPYKGESGETIAVTRLALPITSIQKTLKSFQFSILGFTLLFALISILMAYVISKKTLKPIKSLNQALSELVVGDFVYEQKIPLGDEIEQLCQYVIKLTDHMSSQNSELKMERKTLSTVLNQMTDAVFILDGEGLVQLSNPAAERMFNFNSQEIKRKSIIEAVRNHQLAHLWKKTQQERTQVEETIELLQSKNFIHAIAKPLDEIVPGGVLLVVQDLTHVRYLEKIRSDFVSNVSHELRTPIASIKALSDTLQESALDDLPAARRFLSRMDIEIENLTVMVQELLELSKIESGRVPVKRTVVQVEELVSNAIDRMQLQAQRSGVSLEFSIEEDLPMISVDVDKIGQVFVNLLHNAIKFTPPGGKILVKAVRHPEGILFSVEDNGVGIDEKALDRIFERFYKIDKARSTGGTGLGLSITKHLIETHQGRIWVESELGKGSRFFFILPN